MAGGWHYLAAGACVVAVVEDADGADAGEAGIWPRGLRAGHSLSSS